MKNPQSITPDMESECSVDKFYSDLYLIKTKETVSELQLEGLAEVQTLITKVKLNFTFSRQPDSKQWLLMFSRFAGTNFSRFARTIHDVQGMGC